MDRWGNRVQNHFCMAGYSHQARCQAPARAWLGSVCEPAHVLVKNFCHWLNDPFPESNVMRRSKGRKRNTSQHGTNLKLYIFHLCVLFWRSFWVLWTLNNLLWLWLLYVWKTVYMWCILIISMYIECQAKNRIKEIHWMAIWLLCFQQARDNTLGPFHSLVAQLWECSVVSGNWSYFTVKWKTKLMKDLVIDPLRRSQERDTVRWFPRNELKSRKEGTVAQV